MTAPPAKTAPDELNSRPTWSSMPSRSDEFRRRRLVTLATKGGVVRSLAFCLPSSSVWELQAIAKGRQFERWMQLLLRYYAGIEGQVYRCVAPFRASQFMTVGLGRIIRFVNASRPSISLTSAPPRFVAHHVRFRITELSYAEHASGGSAQPLQFERDAARLLHYSTSPDSVN
jgi:hypothetical protein